jgi:Phage capsid family/Caudovirus prohead serine protease
MLNRAYSLLEIKAVDDEARVITGMASTPTPDRLQDVVEPDGAQFKLPMPLLFHHDSEQPIGHVIKAKVSKAGIEIVAKIKRILEPGRLKDRLDEAWQSLKGTPNDPPLVNGLSIGFKPIEEAFIKETNGIRFIKWDWLELSAVTIPANSEATIATVKSIDTAQRAASGQAKPRRVVHLNPPGAPGQSQPKSAALEGAMKTIAEQITALEAKRAASATRMEAVMQKSLDEDRTSDAAEQDEFDTLSSEVEAIDKDLVRLRKIEQAKAFAAKAVKADDGAASRGGSIIVKAQPTLEPGIELARRVKVRIVSRATSERAADIAAAMYGSDSEVAAFYKAAVPAGTTITGNWAANLIGAETGGAAVAAFLEYLRPRTILGRFGTGGVPALTSVPFRVPIVTQTGAGAGYWVGEAKAKPLTSFAFTRTTLTPLKVANICVLSMENIQFSDPKSDALVRNQLAEALRARLDTDFITPSKAAVTNVSPASITNGAATIVSTGDDADDIRLDVRSLLAKFNAANNPPSTAVFIMTSACAQALAMMVNPLGQPEFPSMGSAGGTVYGMPVIVSDYVPAGLVVLVNATDIFLADDGDVSVDQSTEASLEMSDAPAHDSSTPTGASLVSMFQTNSVAVRAERMINWVRGRSQSVAYLTSADWGGPVHTA